MRALGHGASPPDPHAGRRTSGWSDPELARVGDVATAVAGLVFSASRQPSAESAMRRVMHTYRIARPVDLHAAVSKSGEVRDALLAELTIGESYFFREGGQLSLIESEVLPAWRAEGGDTPRRIWCAGCASGEEPYSLAILLRELGWLAPTQILGTDIARPRLDAARRGRYTKWALRGVAEPRIARWFTRRGPHFLLDDGIRGAVEFRALNLAAEGYPSTETATTEQDLILCRNVLIYFDMSTVAEIAERLLRSLRPNGLLILGASDPPLTDLVACEIVMTPAGAVYRPRDGTGARARASRFAAPASPFASGSHGIPAEAQGELVASTAPPLPIAPPASPPASPPAPPAPPAGGDMAIEVAPRTPASAYALGDYETSALLARAAVERDPGDVRAWVLWIRSVANAGQLVVAGEICAGALDRHRVVPELHYLHGMLLVESGRSADGARDARRALYLDRTFVLAHMLLGDALARLDDRAGARRAFANAADLLEGLPAAMLVLASDGIPVGRLRQICVQRIGSLSDQEGR